MAGERLRNIDLGKSTLTVSGYHPVNGVDLAALLTAPPAKLQDPVVAGHPETLGILVSGP